MEDSLRSINPKSTAQPESWWKRAGTLLASMWMFYWQWFKYCFGQWTLVSTLATALPLILAALAWFIPKVGVSLGDLAWKIPVVIFAVLWVIRFFLAPYWMYREKEEQALLFALDVEAYKRDIDQLNRALESKDATQNHEPEAKPTIEVVIGTTRVAHTMTDVWIADVGSAGPFLRERLTGIVALISNVPVKVIGKNTPTAYSLATSVTIYDDQDRRIGSVSRTHWLSNSANNLDLAPGEHRTALVGCLIGDSLALYENPRTQAVTFRSARHRVNSLPITGMLPTIQQLPTSIRIDLIVISIESGETLAIAKARLSRQDEKGFEIHKLDT